MLALRLCWTDWRWRRLPNREVALLAVLILPYAWLNPGWEPGWLAGGLTLLFGALLFGLKVCGAGDVKLLTVLALWVPGQFGSLLLLLALTGLSLTLVVWLQGRRTVPYGCAMLLSAALLALSA